MGNFFLHLRVERFARRSAFMKPYTFKYLLITWSVLTAWSVQAQNLTKMRGLWDITNRQGIADSTFIRLNMEIADEFLFNNPDTSEYFVERARQKALEIHDTLALAKAFNYLGIIEYGRMHYLTARENCEISQNYYKKGGDATGALKALNNIGIIYTHLDEGQMAVRIYEEAFRGNMSNGRFDDASDNLYNIIAVMLEEKEFDQASRRLKTLDSLIQVENLNVNSSALWGEIYLKTNQPDSAVHRLKIALEASTKENDNLFMASLDLDLAEAFIQLKNYPVAFDYLQDALAIIESDQYNELKLSYLELLAKYYKETGSPDLAYSTILKFNACKDSLDLINNRHRISELNARYESEKRETEIARQAQLIEKKSAQFGTVLMAALGASLVALFIFISLIRKRRMNKLLQEQNAEIVLQRQKIISSINYARRIQSSILPDSDLLKNLVSDAFIYFKPRDIVSGDFYWYKEIDDQLYIATVDCTGHGVPGAFMSLIASAKLNKVVMEMGIREPGQILTQVHHEIVQSLRQSEDSQSSQDGMDISLCLIDFKTRRIKFSGANSSVFLKTEEGLKEIKSKPLSIGGQLFNRMVASGTNVFETVDVEYSIGDRLFMYTDGFPDQLGGEDQKKLNKARFKRLLDALSLKDFHGAHDQCEYILSDWRKSQPQTDDILLVGIRL